MKKNKRYRNRVDKRCTYWFRVPGSVVVTGVVLEIVVHLGVGEDLTAGHGIRFTELKGKFLWMNRFMNE